MDSAIVTTQLELLKERIPYVEETFEKENTYNNVLNLLLEDSKYIALSLRYPYKDYSSMDLPNKYKNWQLRCSIELYNMIGNAGIKAYSENGLSWTRDSSYLSPSLVREIEPMVGYIDIEEV